MLEILIPALTMACVVLFCERCERDARKLNIRPRRDRW